jgi:DNA (cytosine-5)-methyltransferase 1
MTLTLGSLFDGISGFPLAASWAGIKTKWISEIDPYCLKVSKKNFPNAIQYGDIKEIGKGRKWEPEPVTIISGGFPCQPFSVAGKQQGKEDNRYLWPEMLRVIREVKPRWVVGENVPGIINLALDEVLTSLENEGYKTETFIIPACGVNAPHKRDRVWIVAHSDSLQSERIRRLREMGSEKTKSYSEGDQWERVRNATRNLCENILDTNTNSERLQRSKVEGDFGRYDGAVFERNKFAGLLCTNWKDFPTQPPICGRNDGISNRVDRIKALGNAIVPQVAHEIFKALVEIENQLVK